jgi:hypothetical protein
MPKPTRKKAEDALLLALAGGATVEGAARQCGLSERTAYRRLADPGFQTRQQELRADMARRAAGALAAAGTEAVGTLQALLKSESEATRLAAARAIIQLGQKLREGNDWHERLAALERLKVEERLTACERRAAGLGRGVSP